MNRLDVLIRANEYGLYDLVINGSDFDSAYGFETSIPVSFFSDARAPSNLVQEASRRRGWIGNILYIDDGRELGSLLWILDQARITEDTLNLGRSFTQESLQWMIDDNIARSITVTVERTSARGIEIYTDIIAIDNSVQRFLTLWRKTDLSRIL